MRIDLDIVLQKCANEIERRDIGSDRPRRIDVARIGARRRCLIVQQFRQIIPAFAVLA